MTGSLDSRGIDRLVDGELSEAERSELLTRLDGVPDGWKRCALAFLEAQCLRSSVGDLLREAETSRPSDEASSPRAPRTNQTRRFGTVSRWVIAASLLSISFLTGYLTRAMHFSGVVDSSRVVDASPRLPLGGGMPEPAESSEIASIPGVFMVEMNIPGQAAGDTVSYRVPVVSAPGLDESALQARPAALPAEFTRRLERQGYQVEQSRRFVSMDLTDGRRVAIPVDDLEFKLVGPTAY